MSGVCGWYGVPIDNAQSTMDAMNRAGTWSGPATAQIVTGTQFALAARGPRGTTAVCSSGPIHVAVQGHPHWIAHGTTGTQAAPSTQDFCRRAADRYRDEGAAILTTVGGDFAIALIDERRGIVTLAVDRFGVRSIVYQQLGDALIFGETSDVVLVHPLASGSISGQALYDYLYFHMIPAPATVYREHARLQAGHALKFASGNSTSSAYWRPRFSEPASGRIDDFKPAFRAALNTGVASLGYGRDCGAFLSGGTDSSTIAGLLGTVHGAPARTYSIGFSAAGYDEIHYARIAARHFATDHHEYYVTPDDVAEAVQLIAAAFDQPFGNASVIPTYFCARLGHADGVTRMLGGDGGDELFGGNSRYARQYQLALYDGIPAVLRHRLIEPALLGLPLIASIPLVRKAKSYVEQARLPMPARYDNYNLLLRLGPENVFDRDFLAGIDTTRPLALVDKAYADSNARSLINRMLALDWRFTLADNDLPKVTRACDIASVDVAFPMLHESIVDLSMRLPPSFKVRRGRLRYFFKQALADFLPAATLAKQKHGFGLPAGLWLRDHARLRELGGDALAGLRRRGIFRGELLDDLLSSHLSEHAPYYGTLAWVLMMLEMWFHTHSRASL